MNEIVCSIIIVITLVSINQNIITGTGDYVGWGESSWAQLIHCWWWMNGIRGLTTFIWQYSDSFVTLLYYSPSPPSSSDGSMGQKMFSFIHSFMFLVMALWRSHNEQIYILSYIIQFLPTTLPQVLAHSFHLHRLNTALYLMGKK